MLFSHLQLHPFEFTTSCAAVVLVMCHSNVKRQISEWYRNGNFYACISQMAQHLHVDKLFEIKRHKYREKEECTFGEMDKLMKIFTKNYSSKNAVLWDK